MNHLSSASSLEGQLESIDGVLRAYLDHPRNVVHLVCSPPTPDHPPAEPLARAIFTQSDLASSYQLVFSYSEPVPARRRVRLVRTHVETTNPTLCTAAVVLEWMGQEYAATAESTNGGVIGETRAVAEATLATLQQIIGSQFSFQLTGTKVDKVYDCQIIITLVRTSVDLHTPLVGVAQAGGSLAEAAARSVLHATNRVMGNYLFTND